MESGTDPLVSVVLPTYGRPELLGDAIESVLAQSYGNVELVVVDDHSPVSVEGVISETTRGSALRVEYVRHAENMGANAARNTGIRAATGEFIAFLDDDDEWEPDKLARQVTAFKRHGSDVCVVYTGQRFVDETGATSSIKTPTTKGDVTTDILLGEPLGPFSTVMVRAAAIERAGLPDERFPSWQDRDWYIRLSRHCEFMPVPEPLVIRKTAHDDRIGSDFESKRDVSYPLFICKHRSVAASHGERYERLMIASLSRTLGKAALRNGYYVDARKYLLRAIWYQPRSAEPYPYLLAALGGRFTHRFGRVLASLLRP